ncbi:hypothetical protein QBC37DRAFT_421440 [Rhypophila decipiens]|uniref:Polyketide synthase n=1 Tax=Rhypophila decipiens TaxID=261697 RepID=A0AAN6Y8X6_9PEZI|nr:hypothetical protein QBC37DRAFT_421440 [Rhypophila decipiens]
MGSTSQIHPELEALSNQPIAIVGMTCRFPGGVTSPSKLWDLCKSGRDVWSTVPKERFDGNLLYDENSEKTGRHHVKGAHFLEQDVKRFDAAFFNLPADVANALDPQIRQLLEVVYEATEDAGIPIHKLSGSNTSVFTGTWGLDYLGIQTKDTELLNGPALAINTPTFFASRISHFFNLKGQSFSLDTACSSGLVALHNGCQSIWSRESDMSIVGASNLILAPDLFVSGSSQGLLGPDGRCYAWDTRAQGYGRGEGVTALIMKPLDAAIRDGDRVHAIVRGTGVNQDGKTTTITSPSMQAQRELIEACYRRAGLDLADTGYIEAHMTGTQAGDLVESEALGATFGQAQPDNGSAIHVGSVKTNIGHTEPVSGLAAVVKAAIAMKHGQIAPNQNYETPNPKIKLDEWRLKVPISLTKWPENKALRTSINNFGAGGTNAHVILDGVPLHGHVNGTEKSSGVTRHADPSHVYILTSGDATACQDMAKRLSAYIRDSISMGGETTPSPADLAYTLSERRSRLPWAVAIRARSLAELADSLEAPNLTPVHASKAPRLGFVFNGQGAQWYAMGRELIAGYPVFEQSVWRADQVLRHDYGASWSLHEELLRTKDSTRVHQVNISQPINVALQLCLVDLLRSWGVHASAVTSHSSGEIAAAYATGILTFEQALGVVYFRGELALKYQKLTPVSGGMLAAGVGAEEAEKYIKDTQNGRVVVACINSPESVTISGDMAAIEEVAARLEDNNVFARKLQVPLAYHSHHMLPMEQEYIDNLRAILPKRLHDPNESPVLFSSPVTGSIIPAENLTPEHWARNLTNPVRFSESFAALCTPSAGVDMVVEIGAHSTLSGPVRQILKDKSKKMAYTTCLRRGINAVDTIQDLACDLISHGYPLDLKAVNRLDLKSAMMVPDLPSYPWNHSTRYWREPRVSKETRYKKFGAHELLGLPMPGSTGAIPTWRSFLRLSDLPWLADHQVDSKIVLPGAAYVIMAMQATRLIHSSPSSASSGISGFRLRDVNIMNALRIPESSPDGVEVHTRLSPCPTSELDHRGWYCFEISSVDAVSGAWTTNCQGYVAPDMAHNNNPLHHSPPTPNQQTYLAGPAREIETASLYQTMRNMKINHGPVFQNLLKCQASGSKAISTLSIPEVAVTGDDYIIHPTTLDTIIQAMFAGVPEDMSDKYMLLPRGIGTMFIPSHLLGGRNLQAGTEFDVYTEVVKVAAGKGFESNVAVVNQMQEQAPGSGVMRMEGFRFQAIEMERGEADETAAGKGNVCFKSKWIVDGLLHVDYVKEGLRVRLSGDELELARKLQRGAFDLIHDAVVELKDEDKSAWSWYHVEMYEWMSGVVERAAEGKLAYKGSKMWARASRGVKTMRRDELEGMGAVGAMVVRVGRKLPSILRGRVSVHDLMKDGHLLQQYKAEVPRLKSRAHNQLSKIVKMYAAKTPGAKVLEIGAGTGEATVAVLEGFAGMDGVGSLLGRYMFTDLSEDSFAAAKEKLSTWTGLMDFAKLDIETDPTSQSFTPASYDLLVVSNALHATKDLAKTMSHIRQLLKPGGKILMVEATRDTLESHLIFGTTEAWWTSEEAFRRTSPNVGLEIWDRVLRDTGLSGIDLDIPDCEDAEYQSCSVILSTALDEKTPANFPDDVVIVYPADSEPRQEWQTKLGDSITAMTGKRPVTNTLDTLNVDHVQDKVVVFIAEMTKPLLLGINQDTFSKLKTLITNAQGLLWLSRGSLADSKSPEFAQTPGFLRTLRLEQSGNKLIHLDFEQQEGDLWTAEQITHIVHVFGQSFDPKRELNNIDWEYAVKNSMLHVPRVYPAEDMDPVADVNNDNDSHQTGPFSQPGRTLVWQPGNGGTLSNLVFGDSAVDMSSPLPSGMVQIEAKAFGLNFRDIMIALGQIDDTLINHDVAGVITALGPDTEQSGLKVGDRVCGIGRGRFANRCRAFWTSIAKIPDELPWADAAAIPIVYITAYHCLVRLGGLQRGQTVLIHAGAGGVGQAAIVVAQHVGAKIFATCSSAAKKQLLVKEYGLDPANIFSSRDESFVTGVMAATGGRGVDVILNSLSEALLKATWSCIARFGRFIEIGKVDLEADRSLNMSPFARCAVYAGFDAFQLNEYDGLPTHESLTASVEICRQRMVHGSMRPLNPIQEYPISELERAMRQMQSGLHVGKLVLVPGEQDMVNITSRPMPLAKPDATYLIVGGASGIGRSIASWLISQGAKNLVITSRNAETNPDALRLKEEARADGCNVFVQNCDASDAKSLQGLLQKVSEARLPPIKGVINGAMVLRDSVFESMTLDQWQVGVDAKVKSSTNLHNLLLSHQLDFFVLLSSLVGQLGNVSQANYGAGNSFEDALARHRSSLGLPALSLDLSGVTDVGFVATQTTADGTNDVQKRVEGLGSVSITTPEIHRVLERALTKSMASTTTQNSPDDAQILMGLARWDKLPEDSVVYRDRRFGTLRLTRDLGGSLASKQAPGAANNPTGMLLQALNMAASGDEQTQAVARAVAERLAVIFSKPAEQMDATAAMSAHGVDSLVAVELRNWLAASAKAKVSVFEVVQSGSLLEFASLVMERSPLVVKEQRA